MNEKLYISIKRHSPKLKMPEHIAVGNWIDLRSAEDIWIPEGESAMIDLGVSMALPEGYEAIIAPRSSLYKNFGLIQTNSLGVIDNSYNGNNDRWKMPVLCKDGKDFIDGKRGTMVHLNDRICQFRLVENQPNIYFIEVDDLGNSDRGGFGSTGVQ